MLKIEVTQEDIDEGIEGDCFSCPVARAARRAGAPLWLPHGEGRENKTTVLEYFQ